jgi:RimJ/RimL family protein N-acetyltransferase
VIAWTSVNASNSAAQPAIDGDQDTPPGMRARALSARLVNRGWRRSWLDRHKVRFQQHAAIRWAIVPRGSTESIGTVGLAIIFEDRDAANLQIVVGRAYWNKGIGTAAAQLVKSYAFDSLGLVELNAEVLQRNLASVRLLEKVGFHLLRAVPADPQSGSDKEDCFIYVRSRPGRSAA